MVKPNVPLTDSPPLQADDTGSGQGGIATRWCIYTLRTTAEAAGTSFREQMLPARQHLSREMDLV